MKIFAELKRAVKLLENHPGQWALCGGVAASIYRSNARFTDDIDFALVDGNKLSAEALASHIITKLGYSEYQGFIPDSINGTPVKALICARANKEENFVGLDFLLPVQEWVQEAVLLAQENKIDFGFGLLPTITPESLIYAKLIALNNNFERFQDMDDIKDIISTKQIDLNFIKLKIEESKINFQARVLELINN